MNTATPLIPNEIATIYQQVVAHPSRFIDLTPYQRDCLREFAEAKTLELVKQAFNTWQKLGPQYPYPEGTTDRARYWLERAPGYAPNEHVLALFAAPDGTVPATDTPAPSEGQKTAVSDAPARPAPPADPWAVLTDKFTPLALDTLLFDIGLLENAKTQVVKENVKPQVWVAVMEALRNKKLLSKNKKAVAEAFIFRYGEIGNIRSLQRPYEPNNVYARKAFDDTWELVC